jgi:pimeloyl-ACP methyl ester carboxylesterase
MDTDGQNPYLDRSLMQSCRHVLFCSETILNPAGFHARVAGHVSALHPAVFGLAVFGLAVSANAAMAAEHSSQPALAMSTCELTLPGTPLTMAAECGWLEVAENPAEPNGRHIKLRVARVPARERRVEPDPVLFLAGGPGQAASEAWLIIAPAFTRLNKNRDILLIDQRGTGQSHPLRCPQAELAEALTTDWDQLADTTRQCLDALDADPRFYTTTIAMQDYDLVRAALGYEKVNLLGISYGTRAAQVYLRLFPERVRTLVLDGVAPQTLALGTEHAEKLDLALERILASCAANAMCDQAYPQLAESLDFLVRLLESAPEEITVEDPLTGQPLTFVFDRDAFASAIRFLTYSAETQAMLPLLVHEAATQSNYQRIASQLLITASGLSESIAQGMEMSVVCAEDFPLFPEPAADSGRLLGNSMIRTASIQCSIWPRGEVPADFHEPVVSATPALLLSGELDPVTPPEYAEQVKAGFSNSLHLVAPGQGHSVSGRGCLGQVVTDFIVSASLASLDTTCLAQLQASPWFMSLTGPNP